MNVPKNIARYVSGLFFWRAPVHLARARPPLILTRPKNGLNSIPECMEFFWRI